MNLFADASAGKHADECDRAEICKQDAEQRTRYGEQQRFSKNLCHEPAATRADPDTHGKFPLACRSARQK
jgi:hypothetical protein